MVVLFIRHTRVDVAPGTCYGQTDVPLAPTFGQEAADVRARLQAWQPLDLVYTSPLTRASRLAAFCGYPDAIRDPRLMEMDMGQWEMQRYDDIADPALQAWYKDYLHLPATGGESFPQLCDRVASFLDDLRRTQARRVAVFTHGGVVVAATICAGMVSASEAWSHPANYGDIREVCIRP